MLCVFDVNTSDQNVAANVLCDILVILLPAAQAAIKTNKLPPLYKSGVKYDRQNPSACAFRMPDEVFARKAGDCKQLVLWRMAELANAGEKTGGRIIWLAGKKGLQAHAQLRRADGTIEDPSVILGMKALKAKHGK